MIIARSLWRKGLVTAVAAGAFVSLYEVTILDSQYAARLAALRETTALPAPGARLAVQRHRLLQGRHDHVGRRRAERRRRRRSGAAAGRLGRRRSTRPTTATAASTRSWTPGPPSRAGEIDIYMWSCNEALRFGRRPIHLACCGLAGTRKRRRRASSIASSSARSRPQPPPAALTRRFRSPCAADTTN